MWESILDTFLKRLVQSGRITLTWPDGRTTTYGDGAGLAAGIALHDDGIIREIVRDPELGLGEGYMDERVTVENDDLRSLFLIILRNRKRINYPLPAKLAYGARFALRGLIQRNPIGRAKDNVAHHYDLSDALYDLFLDADKQYSCAYWPRPGMTLEQAQEAKKQHIAKKLLIEPDMHVLDIGCGWGGMALTLARDHGARVTGVTLSENQLAIAKRRAKEAGLEDRIDFRLQDYRDLTETFDRIVSVGMLEHVGAPNYRAYFGKVRDLMTDDGVALIHTIGRCNPPMSHSSWIHKYIFPGGYVPSLSELAIATEKEKLWIADLEVWREHYAYTLAEWHRRFEARLDEVRAMYDERFVRMWRYYLIVCECAFLEQMQGVFHLQLSKRMMAVPNTRDYLYD